MFKIDAGARIEHSRQHLFFIMDNGWIKIHRKITDWEWYSDSAVRSVFFDLLIHASHNDYRWKGQMIKRGQIIFGRKEAALRLGISEQSIRTAITKLKSTNEITSKSTNRFTVITLINYTKYQSNDSVSNQQINQQINIQTTNNQPTINHNQEDKELKNKKEEYMLIPGEKEKQPVREGDVLFLPWWELYPRKVGKQAAIKAWKKLNDNEKERALAALPAHVKQGDWQKEGGKFIPHPATWLNGRRWEDELREPDVKDTAFLLKELEQLGNVKFCHKYSKEIWESLPAN